MSDTTQKFERGFKRFENLDSLFKFKLLFEDQVDVAPGSEIGKMLG